MGQVRAPVPLVCLSPVEREGLEGHLKNRCPNVLRAREVSGVTYVNSEPYR